MEGVVLLRVEHFEQGGGRVAVVGHLRHLVDFIKDEHGIARAGLLDALDNTSRHGTDIRTAMTADFGLVVQTA